MRNFWTEDDESSATPKYQWHILGLAILDSAAYGTLKLPNMLSLASPNVHQYAPAIPNVFLRSCLMLHTLHTAHVCIQKYVHILHLLALTGLQHKEPATTTALLLLQA